MGPRTVGLRNVKEELSLCLQLGGPPVTGPRPWRDSNSSNTYIKEDRVISETATKLQSVSKVEASSP